MDVQDATRSSNDNGKFESGKNNIYLKSQGTSEVTCRIFPKQYQFDLATGPVSL
ncbi:hypothetical protein KIN20_010128 [Parelaphostrongylus tenuis]|uniref:Uncharacterized protein n=1 Tax=Parelaphostrongylus tenuis TaxID=148309 RepID=A0AAD5M7F1_PARTN|nr:hypothetical protein KIN20_010128 [Parelaphostrongylus tenuis]